MLGQNGWQGGDDILDTLVRRSNPKLSKTIFPSTPNKPL
jgi:hypothetical protein